MKITSKFDGKCRNCGGRIAAGQECDWERGEGIIHIGTCPEKPAASLSSNGDKLISRPGVFRKDGKIFVVKPNKEKTNFYAKEVVPSAPRMTEAGEVVDFTTVYRKGAIYNLSESDRWDLKEAQEFLTKYARCIVCGRHLKAADSVAASIGPICRGYFA